MNAPSATLAIRFGVLHDHLGEPKTNGVLVVRGGRVASVGGPESELPPDARVVEAACVVPGLVNAHVHLEMSGQPDVESVFRLTTPSQRAFACAANAAAALRSGVTTVRDLGASDALAIDARDAIRAGLIPGPDVLAAGRALCMTGGHGWFLGRQTDGEADAVLAVREQRRAGADCIKLIATGGVLTKGAVPGLAQLTEAELRAAVGEAKRHGMRCGAHAIGASGIRNAVRAGVDSIEHGHLVDDEGIALLRESGARIVPTLAAVRCIVDAGEHAGMPDYVVRKAREIVEHAEANLRRAREAGVTFAGGSDAGTPFNGHGAFAYEVELMTTMLGMTPREALRAATLESASLLGVERGALGAGAAADLVVLPRDVASDVRALREPALVVRAGEIAHEA